MIPDLFGDGRDGDIDLTQTTVVATRDMQHRVVRGTLRQVARYGGGYRVLCQTFDEVEDKP